MHDEFIYMYEKLKNVLDNIVSAKLGALIVVGYDEKIEQIRDGGINISTDYTPEKLFEFAKTDGAIILDGDLQKILYMNAQLNPSSSIETSETGMRHRTAERVAKETGMMVIAVSQRKGIITIYQGENKKVLRSEFVEHQSKENEKTEDFVQENIVLDDEKNSFSVRKNTLNDLKLDLSIDERMRLDGFKTGWSVNENLRKYTKADLAKAILSTNFLHPMLLWEKIKPIYYHENVRNRVDRNAIAVAACLSYRFIDLEGKTGALENSFIAFMMTNENVINTQKYFEILDLAWEAAEKRNKENKVPLKERPFNWENEVMDFIDVTKAAILLSGIYGEDILEPLRILMEVDSYDMRYDLLSIMADTNYSDEQRKQMVYDYLHTYVDKTTTPSVTLRKIKK